MFIKCEVNGEVFYINMDLVIDVKPIGELYILRFVNNCKDVIGDDCTLLVKSNDLIAHGIV